MKGNEKYDLFTKEDLKKFSDILSMQLCIKTFWLDPSIRQLISSHKVHELQLHYCPSHNKICLLNSFKLALTFTLLWRQFYKEAPSYLKLLLPNVIVLKFGHSCWYCCSRYISGFPLCEHFVLYVNWPYLINDFYIFVCFIFYWNIILYTSHMEVPKRCKYTKGTAARSLNSWYDDRKSQ